MQNPTIFWLALTGTCAVIGARYFWQSWKKQKALNAPFPDAWLTIVKSQLPIYEHMPGAEQAQLKKLIQEFLFHKNFIGCAGLEVTEKMRVTIAACACLLLLNRPTLKYKKVRWIYIYPSEFIVRRSVKDAHGVVSKKQHILAGEAWQNGRVILSWDSVKEGVYDFNDGRNVVLHEFAHQLDGESGSTNGAPLLYSKGAYGSWATIMSREYHSLKEHTYFGKKTVLDTYGATNPAEFFAVATETFFEDPDTLAEEHPELFEQLKDYYHLDPRNWKAKPKERPGNKKRAKNKNKSKASGKT